MLPERGPVFSQDCSILTMVRDLRLFAELVMLTEFSKGSVIRCIGKIHGSKAREIIVMICMPLRSLGMKQGVGNERSRGGTWGGRKRKRK